MMDNDSFLTIKNNSGFPTGNLISKSSNQEEYSSSIEKSRISKQARVILPSLPRLDYLPIRNSEQREIGIEKVYLEQALLCFEEQQWSKAITICQQALAKQGDLAEAYKIWGNCLYKQNQLSEAIEQYIKALEIEPEMSEVYANIGSIFAKKKEWNKAIDYYQQALRIKPHLPAVYFNLARLCEELGEIERAEEYLFQGIELNPKRFTAQQHFQLAEQLSIEGKTQLAIICYRHAVTLNPNFVEAYEAYVKSIEILESHGNYKESIKYYPKILALINQEKNTEATIQSAKRIRRLLASPVKSIERSKTNCPVRVLKSVRQTSPQLQALPTSATSKSADPLSLEDHQINEYLDIIRQNPYSAEIQFKLGYLLSKKHQWQSAIRHFGQAITLKPSFIDPYFHLAKIYRQLGKKKLSFKILFKAYNINPSNIPALKHFQLGNFLLEHSEATLASACFQHTINLKPNCTIAYWKLADIEHTKDNLKQAIVYYKKAIIQDPYNITSYQKLGKLFQAYQKWEQAANCYQYIIKLDPNNFESHHSLGTVSAKTKQWKKAIAYYLQAIELNPNYPDSHYALAETFAQTEKWDDAATAYNKAFILNPNLPGIRDKIKLVNDYRQRSEPKAANINNPPTIDEKVTKSYFSVPDLDQANELYFEHSSSNDSSQLIIVKSKEKELEEELKKLKQTIQLESDNSWNYYHLGLTLSKLGKLDEAMTQFSQAIKIEPNASWNYHAIAKILVKQNKLEKAITPCLKFIELEPQVCWGYFDLGEIMLELGKWSKANEAYLSAYNLEPDEAIFSQRLGYTFSHLGASYKSEAIKYYRRGIKLNPGYIELYNYLIELEPKNPEFNLMLANLLMERNEWNAAIVFYQIVLQLDPNCGEGYFHLGELYQKQQQWKQAISFYKTALSLEPSQAKYQYQVGEVLVQFGLLPEAISHYQQAIKLEPKLVCAHLALGNALVKKKSWIEALSAYKKAQTLDSESAIIYKKIGDILAQQNKIAEASQAYLCAIERDFKLF